MKKVDYREFTTAELQDNLAAERETVAKLKLNHAVSPLENPSKIRFTKRAIAKILTELNKRKNQPSA